MQAAVRALQKFPILNASIDGDSIVYKRDINVGVAVSLEGGLIVPVVKKCGREESAGPGACHKRSGRTGAKQEACAG
jgi:2-oxoglutarate dehydrogenase E2 component (dihydrolipoamide succinyltransferase)